MVSEDLMLMPNLVPQCEALKLYRADLEQHIKEKKVSSLLRIAVADPVRNNNMGHTCYMRLD